MWRAYRSHTLVLTCLLAGFATSFTSSSLPEQLGLDLLATLFPLGFFATGEPSLSSSVKTRFACDLEDFGAGFFWKINIYLCLVYKHNKRYSSSVIKNIPFPLYIN